MKEVKEEKNNEMLLVQSRRSISAACFTLKERAERRKNIKKCQRKWVKDKKTEERSGIFGWGSSGLVMQQTTAYTKITFKIPFTKNDHYYYYYHH